MIQKKLEPLIKMNKFVIEDAVFYITNVCNLSCKDCESFNNYRFKGHFLWETHSQHYEKWAQLLDLKSVNIHGGEPLLNRDILNWAKNLIRLWPEADTHYISSNGSIIHNHVDVIRECIELGWSIDIVVHEPTTYNSIKDNLESILSPYKYNIIPEESGDRKEYRQKKTNRLLASLDCTYHFRGSAIKEVKDGVVHLQRSNPKKAYKQCVEGLPPCVPFIRGYMYSCLLTSLITDFLTQFNVEQEAAAHMKKYRPASPWDPMDKLKKHIDDIYRPRKMCTFCPDSKKEHAIFPMPKTKPEIP